MRAAAIAIFPLLLVGGGGLARADASLPSAHRGASGPSVGGGARGGALDWRGACAARLERARDEAAQSDPLFVYGFVENLSREMASAGDPTARAEIDVVEMKIEISPGQMYLVRVEPSSADAVIPAPAKWSQLPWPRTASSLNVTRGAHHLLGTLLVTMGAPRTVKLFERVFERAVDDCLAHGKVL